jgi:hypothetical protein
MIVKVEHKEVWPDFVGDWRLASRFGRNWPLGRATLSFKVGKKRKLVNGHIRSEPESCPLTGLHYNHYFVPSNPAKLHWILQHGPSSDS